MVRSTEEEIKRSYKGRAIAEQYFADRFETEIHRMLHRRQVGAVREAIKTISARRLLEIAPGPGRLTRDIHFDGEHVCLEYNQGMIDIGKRLTDPGVTWLQGDAFDLPSDGSFELPFDMAYSFRFIRHFRTRDRNRLYRQLRRSLRPNGLLVFDAVNGAVSRPLRESSPEDYPIYDVLYDDIEDLRHELSEAGFEMTRAEPVQRNIFRQGQSEIYLGPRSRLLNRLVINAFEWLSRGSPLEWIITCGRV